MSKKGLLMSTEITIMHADWKQLRTDHNNMRKKQGDVCVHIFVPSITLSVYLNLWAILRDTTCKSSMPKLYMC